jgi:hypothetical protein
LEAYSLFFPFLRDWWPICDCGSPILECGIPGYEFNISRVWISFSIIYVIIHTIFKIQNETPLIFAGYGLLLGFFRPKFMNARTIESGIQEISWHLFFVVLFVVLITYVTPKQNRWNEAIKQKTT